ncbi:MAG: DNA polymerase III subunit gamma/tau [Chloroflexota bacterium]
MSQTLYRKWRPQRWEDVVGQEHVVQTLRNSVASNRFAHAFIFSGPRGTGKTTTARILAKALNCLAEDGNQKPCGKCQNCLAIQDGRFLDLIEIDAASNTSVEDVRDLRDKINFAPNQGRYKVYIIDEVHMLSTQAFNALLKTLEEPPPHAIFVLATTEVHKIPATVLSRCQRHEFRRISLVEIVRHLEQIVKEEGWKAEPQALQIIARQATGSMRDAISLLDQLASSGQEISVAWVNTLLGTVASQSVIEMVEALLHRQTAEGLQILHKTLDSGADARTLARQTVDYLRNLLLTKTGNASEVDAPADIRQRLANHAQMLSTSDILAVIHAFNQAVSEGRNAWLPALPLEMAYLEALTALQPVEEKPQASPPPSPGQKKVVFESSDSTTETPTPLQDVSAGGESSNAPSGLTLELVKSHWREIRARVRQQNPNIEALLNSCKPLAVKDGRLYLAFNGEFAKQKFERPEILKMVTEIAKGVMGVQVEIQCFLGGAEKGELPPGVPSDGIIAAALRMGGEIVDIQE